MSKTKHIKEHDFLRITENRSENLGTAEVLERLLEACQIHLEKGELTEKGTDPAVFRSQSRLPCIPRKKLGILLTEKDYVRCGCVNGKEERGPQTVLSSSSSVSTETNKNSKGQESSRNDNLQLVREQ